MEVIDLLNKIANREEVPKKIKYDTKNYYFRNYDYKEYYIDEDYIDEQTSFIDCIDFYKLNDEIEIIEEDKPIEKLDYEINENNVDTCTEKIRCKINEIIDKLNELEESRKK